MTQVLSTTIESFIVDRIDVGVLAINRNFEVSLWNRFMIGHSGIQAEQIIGQSLFKVFPELDVAWLQKKIESVFLLGNYAFTSNRQRPYLFAFEHNRPFTGSFEYMRQDCTFLPIKNEHGEVIQVAIIIFDTTDTAHYRQLMKQALADKEEISIRDALTGLYNRRYIERTVAAEFQRSQRHGRALSVIMTDIDFFKHVNDGFGHGAGDQVLVRVARCFERQLRGSDVAGRVGGEEFVLILPETTAQAAEQVAERIRQAIEAKSINYKDLELSITLSLGVNTLTQYTKDYEQLLDQADHALYQAKRRGRNQVVVYQ